MVFTEETKMQFVDMFGNHEIVTVSRQYGKTSASWEQKFIGVRNGMKWDFTPLVIHLSNCKTNASGLAARGFYKEILKDALIALSEEGFDVPQNYVRSISDFCQIFYF